MLSAFVAGTSPQPISSLIGVNQPSTTPSSNSSGASSLGPDSFLQLLTTELQNQDPTQPQDPTQSVSQLAQFSALQYQQQLASSFSNFQSNFGVLQTASLIGKQATVNVGSSGASGGGGGSTVTGTIATVEVQNGTPYFTMTDSSGKAYTDGNGNPLLFSTSEITGISGGSSSTTPATNGSNRVLSPTG